METMEAVAMAGVRGVAGGMEDLELLGGRQCLDFANTVDRSARDERRHEYLGGYPDLVAWGRHAGVLTEDEAEQLLEGAKGRPRGAEAVFRRALALRDAVQEVFYAIASGKEPLAPKLGVIEEEYCEALAHSRITRSESGFEWTSEGGEEILGKTLWSVARSAEDLLTSSVPSELGRVRRCPGDEGHCGWLFLDTTKNGTRRWCSMAGCGSRAKMRRLYRRRRDAADQAARPAQPPGEG